MESCGLICHQYLTRVYGKLTCANLAVVTLRGVGPRYCRWCTALVRKVRISSSICSCNLYTDNDLIKEGLPPSHCGPQHYNSAGSSAGDRSASLRRSLQTLQGDRVCFNLLCAFLSFTPHELTELCL